MFEKVINMGKGKHIRVGCYVRVSTDNQIENYSIEEQTDRLKAYCAAKDWEIYKFYTDGGYSGGNVDRPALQQMLGDIRDNKIEMVVVYKLDRLSRSQKDTLTLIEDEFLSHDVEFVSISENFDTSSPFGRAMIGILSVFAQLEKEQITERFTMGRLGRGKAGYYHGGPTPPTGYDYIDGKLVVNEYQATQVKEAYRCFLSGYSLNAVQRHLSEKYGGWSSASHTVNVLRNSVYVGKVKFKGQEFDGIHTPIIDKGTFEKVQEILSSSERESRKTSAQKTPFRAGFLLSSLVFCGKCGARYSANHGYYKCYSRSKSSRKFIIDPDCKNQNWKIEDLDSLIISRLQTLDYEEMKNKNAPREKTDAAAIMKREKEIDTQIARMIDLYQIGGVPIAEINKRITSLQKEKKALNERISGKANSNEKKSFLDALSKLDSVLQTGSLEEKRLLISSLVERIEINENRVNVKLRF